MSPGSRSQIGWASRLAWLPMALAEAGMEETIRVRVRVRVRLPIALAEARMEETRSNEGVLRSQGLSDLKH